jgi:hypothetical protein
VIHLSKSLRSMRSIEKGEGNLSVGGDYRFTAVPTSPSLIPHSFYLNRYTSSDGYHLLFRDLHIACTIELAVWTREGGDESDDVLVVEERVVYRISKKVITTNGMRER